MSNFHKPTIIFVCQRNSGRSQIAAGYLKAVLGDRVDVRSAGTEPAPNIDDRIVALMNEEGIDLSRTSPRLVTSSELMSADRVIAMGCDVGNLPRVDETWEIADIEGLTNDELRSARDTIKRLVFGLSGALSRHELGLPGEAVLV